MPKLILSFILSTLLTLPVSAQVTSSVDRFPSGRQELQREVRQKTQDLRQNLQQQLRDFRSEIEAKREAAKAEFEAKEQKFREELEAKKAEVKQKMEAARAELAQRLRKIKDEKKKAAVERIANQINELNKRQLAHFEENLKKLSRVLERIVSRSEKAAARGLDVSKVRTQVDAAKAAIDAAYEAIKVQSGKVYSLLSATTTESGLREEVGRVRQLFHDDLDKVKQAVKAARDAVHQAAVILGQIRGVDEEPTPTPTPTSTPPPTPTST
jgi:DNA repair exonuclease SbcCD ATPase subunit